MMKLLERSVRLKRRPTVLIWNKRGQRGGQRRQLGEGICNGA